jgi:single-stranded-DNA-specific exonuclease
MEKRWIVAEQPDAQVVESLSKELAVPPLVAMLLAARGYRSHEDAHAFITPRLAYLHNPLSLGGMEQAVDRLGRALDRGERIMVFGDYDVDGITATALLYRSLTALGGDVVTYIPHRLREGYGVSVIGLEEAKRVGVSLLITVDCGVTARDELALASEWGIDAIVTDHHEAKEGLPHAVAVVDPKKPGETYPFRELAGVGVAFKLLHALYIAKDLDRNQLKVYLDLVALGTVADIVPLVDENRVLAFFGMHRLMRSINPGMRSLIQVSGLEGKRVTSYDIGFVLGPRINAAGRIGEPKMALRLLITDDPEEAQSIASMLDQENVHRKDMEQKVLDEAVSLVTQQVDLERDRAIVLAKQGFHRGVIGVVASRVAEIYYRPTVLIALDGDTGKGSGRSIPGFDLYDALKCCREYLTRFGGHQQAAGLSIEAHRVDEFARCFVQRARELLTDEDLSPKVRVDVELPLSHIDERLMGFLDRFRPFGPRNPQPVFLARGLEVVGEPLTVGDGHLKYRVRSDDTVHTVLGFGQGEMIPDLEPGKTRIDLVFTVSQEEFAGKKKMTLFARDLRIVE